MPRVCGDFFAADVGADKVYRPGKEEALIATLGLGGKIILAARIKTRTGP